MELKEYICQENNQYLINVKDDFDKPYFKKGCPRTITGFTSQRTSISSETP